MLATNDYDLDRGTTSWYQIYHQTPRFSEMTQKSRKILQVGVSLNGCTPKPSILIGFSIIFSILNHPFWVLYPYFWVSTQVQVTKPLVLLHQTRAGSLLHPSLIVAGLFWWLRKARSTATMQRNAWRRANQDLGEFGGGLWCNNKLDIQSLTSVYSSLEQYILHM